MKSLENFLFSFVTEPSLSKVPPHGFEAVCAVDANFALEFAVVVSLVLILWEHLKKIWI